jgi:hypothetical protein
MIEAMPGSEATLAEAERMVAENEALRARIARLAAEGRDLGSQRASLPGIISQGLAVLMIVLLGGLGLLLGTVLHPPREIDVFPVTSD